MTRICSICKINLDKDFVIWCCTCSNIFCHDCYNKMIDKYGANEDYYHMTNECDDCC